MRWTISTQLRITFFRQVGNENVRNASASLILSYQNSDADSVLIHHQDIALLLEVKPMIVGNISCSIFHTAWKRYRLVHPADREAATNHSG